MHSYIVAFWWSAGIFAVAALLAGPLLRQAAAAPGRVRRCGRRPARS
ncbi:MAG TPA: hypothetical protein VH373_10245 [Jatrophihabitantaceae bacterium]